MDYCTCNEELEEDVNIAGAQEVDEEDRSQPFVDYLQHGKLPSDLRCKTKKPTKTFPLLLF